MFLRGRKGTVGGDKHLFSIACEMRNIKSHVLEERDSSTEADRIG
jgi:hypothetical protein